MSGSFSVSGGNGQNITVYIMNGTSFVNWKEGHGASSYYDSGQVNNGSIAVMQLSGGTYFLIFDNTFDMASQKNVDSQVFFWFTPYDRPETPDWVYWTVAAVAIITVMSIAAVFLKKKVNRKQAQTSL